MQQYQQQIFPGLEKVGQPVEKQSTPVEHQDQPKIPEEQCFMSVFKNWSDDDLDQLQQIKENSIKKNLAKMRRLLSSGKLRNIYFLEKQLEDDIQYLALNEIIARKYNGLSNMNEIKDELKSAVETQVENWYHWDRKSHEEKLALIEMMYKKNEKALQNFLTSKSAREFAECYKTIRHESNTWEAIEIEQQLRYGQYRRARSLKDIKPKNNWFGERNHSTLDPRDIYQTIQKKTSLVKTLKK